MDELKVKVQFDNPVHKVRPVKMARALICLPKTADSQVQSKNGLIA